MNLNELQINWNNLSDYPLIKIIREAFMRDVYKINLENNVGEYDPFIMSKEEAKAFASKFYQDPVWLANLANLNHALKTNIVPENVMYPWWNDVTMNIYSGSIGTNTLITEYSHSYFSQLNKQVTQERKPLSIIIITETSDQYFVLASKSGAYNGKLMFIPSGSFTFNNSHQLNLDNVIEKQFSEELNTTIDLGRVSYSGTVYDPELGKNYLLVLRAQLPHNRDEIDSMWRGCKGDFEFLKICYVRKEYLKKHADQMLNPARLCLFFL